MKNNFKEKRKKGFSLLELILAIFILSVPLITFMETITKSMEHSMESRDTIIAANLAQEGAELVKNIRDNNWARDEAVFAGINAGSYMVDYNDYGLTLTSPILKFDGSYYNTSNGNNTKFSRSIAITADGSGSAESRTIISYVTWEKSSFPSDPSECFVANKCVYAIIILTKWGGE